MSKPGIHRWPVSVGVGPTIIEGLLVNRMVLKSLMKIITYQQMDRLEGMIMRFY